jgi:branched-chain amino acid transport system ATP-binding protein
MRRAGKTVILVEHNMKIIQRLVDCVYVLDGGELLASGTVAKILKNKKVREAYFGK